MTITYRATKGSRLTIAEMDANFSTLASATGVFAANTTGYDPTGVSDSTAAVLAIISAAGDRTIYWSGTPLISATITISSGRHVFEGKTGINSSTRPGSYIIKASSLNGYAIQVGGSASLVGGGVVAEEGNGSSNIRIVGNSARWEGGYSENAGAHGWFVDGSSNSNHCTLIHCRSYGNTTHGFYLTGDDANACTFLNCFAQSNGGDGFFSEKTGSTVTPAWNTFMGCGADANTGYGIRLKGGTDNAIVGGDFEANTAGDIYIDATESFTTLTYQNRGSVITDNGFYTRRLDQYRSNFGSFTAAIRGASGATKTATAVTISGATATVTSAGHGFSNGDTIQHQDFSNGNLNGAFVIANVAANTYDFTFRTDTSVTVPTSATGLTVTVQKCGVSTVTQGNYWIRDGICEGDINVTMSAVTNITGSVQLILPFDTLNVGANSFGQCDISYYSGVTHTAKLTAIIPQNGARVANLYDTIGGTPDTPAQLNATGLAATTVIIAHFRYRVGSA